MQECMVAILIKFNIFNSNSRFLTVDDLCRNSDLNKCVAEENI